MNQYKMMYNTLKFLKKEQIYYRFYYFFRKKIRDISNKKYLFTKDSKTYPLVLQKSIHITDCYIKKNNFNFLNLNQEFKNNIDWNHASYGKLWTYNLNYFDYLSQIDKEDTLYLINSFIQNIEKIQDGLEPFPISLRGINWIKYLSYHQIEEKHINDSLYAQYYILLDNLEYHLLGNHLLENAFSLLFASYYFQDDILYKKSKEILIKELTEQILKDGAHFELSPMYHQIMLFRVLDCINLLNNNSWKDNELLIFLKEKSMFMLGWLNNISYKNGEIPHFNDSTNNVAPTTIQLFDYADRLEIKKGNTSLSDSGYRKISYQNYECIIDIGHIGAEYIPGHAHSDTFNFELRIDSKPFIVDMGISTYETNDRRMIERSTRSHNTVEVNNKSQSEVWAGFRVANRATIITLNENKNLIYATHDGYKKDNILHTREWKFHNSKINITDNLTKESTATSRFHFHPSISKKEILEKLTFNRKNFKIVTYSYSLGFNDVVEAFVLEIPFVKDLIVTIDNLGTK